MSKKISIHLLLRLLVVVGMFAAGALLYSRLPEQFPMHWNINGEVDNWAPKETGVWIIPLVALGLIILFPLLSKLDPKRANYKKFEKPWDIIQTVIVTFMGYVYGWQLYLTLTDVDGKLLGQGILFALGIMFIILGNFLGKVRQNYFVGIKTPWTLNNEEVWQKTQRVGGWMMVIAGILLLIEAFFFQWAFSVMIGIIVLILIVPVVYSYVISRE